MRHIFYASTVKQVLALKQFTKLCRILYEKFENGPTNSTFSMCKVYANGMCRGFVGMRRRDMTVVYRLLIKLYLSMLKKPLRIYLHTLEML